MRRRRVWERSGGRWERIWRLSATIVVVAGVAMLRERSGIEAVKRIIRWRISSSEFDSVILRLRREGVGLWNISCARSKSLR